LFRAKSMWTRELYRQRRPTAGTTEARAERAIGSDLSREVVMTIPTVRTRARVADVSDSGAVNEMVAGVRRRFPAVVIIDDEIKPPAMRGFLFSSFH
jgi:hypothetical protein